MENINIIVIHNITIRLVQLTSRIKRLKDAIIYAKPARRSLLFPCLNLTLLY